MRPARHRQASAGRADQRFRAVDAADGGGVVARMPGSTNGRNGEQDALLALLELEEDIRITADQQELLNLIANRTSRFTTARQVLVFRNAGKLRLEQISGLTAVDRSAPLVGAFERIVAKLIATADETADDTVGLEVDLADYASESTDPVASYPYCKVLWVPFKLRNGALLGGMLLASDTAFSDAARTTAQRLRSAYTQALALQLAEPRLMRRLAQATMKKRGLIGAVVVALILLMCIPIKMSTVAPMEIVPRNPAVVAAPIEGAIRDVFVEPGQSIEAGDKLVQFADTDLRNKLAIAQREVRVAVARLDKSAQMAFDNARGRQEIGIASADLDLKTAKKNFAKDILDRATIVASRPGIALFADRANLIGKPVSVGERLMLIADPNQVEIEILVPVSDAIILKPGAGVTVFLDSDPLTPRSAKLAIADYKSRRHDDKVRSFRVVARFTDDGAIPRLGGSGSAQLFGETVPLAFYLFRRPLSASRQWLGL